MSIDLMINGINIVLLIVMVIYIMIKDKDVERRIKNIEISMDTVLKEGYKNSQILSDLVKKNSPLEYDKIKTQLENSINGSLKANLSNELKLELKEYIKQEIDKAMMPLLSNLSNMEENIKDFQFEQQDRMVTLEQKNKEADRLSTMSQNEEEQQILDMHAKGYSVEQISKELKIASGRVEFIIKLKSKNI